MQEEFQARFIELFGRIIISVGPKTTPTVSLIGVATWVTKLYIKASWQTPHESIKAGPLTTPLQSLQLLFQYGFPGSLGKIRISFQVILRFNVSLINDGTWVTTL